MEKILLRQRDSKPLFKYAKGGGGTLGGFEQGRAGWWLFFLRGYNTVFQISKNAYVEVKSLPLLCGKTDIQYI